MFNINFITLVVNLLPSFLRKSKMIAWLTCLVKPVVDLYSTFLDYRTEKLYEARITGQVDSLEKMLNDRFWTEGGERKITITDGENTTAILIYNSAETEEDTLIYNTAESETDTMLYNSNEVEAFDFVVNIDVAMVYDVDVLLSFINKYKLAGTTYKINILQ